MGKIAEGAGALTRPWMIAALAVALSSVALSGHEVPVEQLVEMTVRPVGDRLVVRMHVPATALTDANLPVLADGTLDAAQLDGPSRVAAAETARNLDAQQDDTALAPLGVTARQGADQRSVDIELTYRIDPASAGFSARLNIFPGTPLRPVRTDVHYFPNNRPAQVLSLTGAPQRVRFDPGAIDAASLLAARALTSILTPGDHLLWLLCLLLPLRTARDATRAIGATIGGQALAIAAGAVAPAMAGLGPAAALIAASAVVMGCLQDIVAARQRAVLNLSILFGLLNGLAFGGIFVAERQFAGSHQAIALIVFMLIVAASQLWLAAIMWATRAWLATLGMPERITTVVGSALIAHEGVHRMLDRGHALAGGGSFISTHALTLLTLGWAGTMLLIAAAGAIRRRGVGGLAGLPEDGRG